MDNLNSTSKVKVIQSCLTLCNPKDYTVHGILQARILEWVAFPSPGDLSNPGIKPRSSALQADFLPAEPPGKSNSRDTRPFLEGGNSHGLFHRASHHMAACFSKTNIESQIEPHREKNRERERETDRHGNPSSDGAKVFY